MIDKKPAVGRILLGESIMTDGFVRRAGVISKISGKRIYFINKNGNEEYVQNFGAVCDTPEEEEALINHSWGCVEQVINIRKENGQIFKNFFTKEV